ncbi:MAG: GNAT family N-acetyltransferase [Elusimicrobia bacterium RIFOXYB2_FULL_49_7]|nr:MAG: GNAT family N-acetyltransferase [Elusimicrobia bacterium RIFOXYB2_FULL_49_7]
MLLERAVIEDASQILEIQKLAYQSEAILYNDSSLPPLTQTIDELRQQFTSSVFIKAVDNNQIIGSVRAYEKEGTCYIGRLIVHPDHQKQGIGTKLMHEIEKIFIKSTRFELFTGSKSKKNIRFYEKRGYIMFKIDKINDKVNLMFMEKLNR